MQMDQERSTGLLFVVGHSERGEESTLNAGLMAVPRIA